MLFRDGYIKRKYRKLATHRYNIVAPIIQKLDAKEDVTQSEVLVMVKDPSLRHGVFRILEKYKRTDLFPHEYFTREKGAEGFLVNWLEFPTELGNAPDEIELHTMVTILESEKLDYYVFKYRAKTPRWAGQLDWMIGVSGPYFNDSKPFDVPRRVFSRFKTFDSISAEHEVQWVHENISKA
jgi:hypothetical protein